MTWEPKYTDAHKDFIRPLWAEGHAAAEIAKRLNAEFGMAVTRCAIIGLCKRMKLPNREQGGVWRIAGVQKRAQTMTAKGGYPGGHKKPPVLAPPESPKPPVGEIGEFPQEGMCKYPVSGPGEMFQCCAHPAIPRKPYCAAHAAICFTPVAKSMKGSSRADRAFRS